jgi:signal transduction histidine kinase
MMRTDTAPSLPNARRERLRECTLLLVDDEMSNLDLLEGVLEADGYTRLVRTADARQVLALTGEHEPDLILLDLHMPHRNGLEVLQDLAAQSPPDAYRPVLVLTADATLDARDRALSLGARDFVTKPFDVTEVLLRVENLLDTRVLHRDERNARLRAEEAEANALALLAEAQLATTERERLLAVVAHDLRNPLGAIAMYGEMLSNLQPDDSTGMSTSELRVRDYTRTALDTIHTSAAAMQRLVQDLLDASTLKGGALRIARAPIAVNRAAEYVIRMLAPRADAAGVTLALETCDDVVSVDGPRFTQLLGNLVSNALNVTPSGGSVRVTLSSTSDGSALAGTIADTGPGIPPELMPHLFTAFWRGERRDRDGVGLGLWIARAIAEAHGGDLTAVSRPGAGAVFSFVLPFTDRERRPED